MADQITFKIDIDTTEAEADLASLNKKLASASRAFKATGDSFTKTTRKKNEAGRSAHLKYLSYLRKQNQAEVKANAKSLAAQKRKYAAQQKADKGYFQSFASKLGLSVASWTAAIAAVILLMKELLLSVINVSKAYASMEFSLKAVTDSQLEYNEAMAFTRGLVANYGGDLISITRQYTKFLAATKNSNLSLTETNLIYENLHKSAAILHLDNAALERSFKALEQMISKGVVSSEELRQQLGDHLPGAYTILAESMGITSIELAKQLKLGQVMADEVLPAFSEALVKAYGGELITKITTFTTETQKLGTAWSDFLITLSDEEAMTEAAKALRGLLLVMEDAGNSSWWTFVKRLGFFFPGIATTVNLANMAKDALIDVSDAKDVLDNKVADDAAAALERFEKRMTAMRRLSAEAIKTIMDGPAFKSESERFQKAVTQLHADLTQVFVADPFEINIFPEQSEIDAQVAEFMKHIDQAIKDRALEKADLAVILSPGEGEDSEETEADNAMLQAQADLYGVQLDLYATYWDKKKAIQDAALESELLAAQAQEERMLNIQTAYIEAGFAAADIFTELANTRDVNNKKEFEQSKKLRKAAVVMNTAAGITNALMTGAPYVKWVDAAAVGVSGGIQWASINKQTYDGGGSSPSGSGSSTSSPAPQVSNIDPVASGRSIAEMERTQAPQKAYVVQSDLEVASAERQTIAVSNTI